MAKSEKAVELERRKWLDGIIRMIDYVDRSPLPEDGGFTNPTEIVRVLTWIIQDVETGDLSRYTKRGGK